MLANSHQQAVIKFVRTGDGHGLVEATAGSGKTTTLVMVARLLVDEVLRPGQRAAFLAFNRSTAAELRARLPAQVEAVTLHALGLQVIVDSRHLSAQLEPGKYQRLATDLVADRFPPTGTGSHSGDHLATYLAETFGFARLELTDLDDPAAIASLRNRYDLRPPLPPAELPALEALLPTLARAGTLSATIDYTDMLHLPLSLDLEVPRLAFICVDEAQDLSRLALGLVQRLVAAGARALFVGDPYQAIYEFAGADAGSLERIQRLTRATRLPLSVSFRCPSKHVVLARRFSPEMKTAAGAIRGTVALAPLARLARLALAGDMVMTRTNAPLPDLALRLVGAGLFVRVLGHDLVGEAKLVAAELYSSAGTPTSEESVRESAERDRLRLEQELLTSDELPAELERSRNAHTALSLVLRRLQRSQPRPTMADIEAELDMCFAGSEGHVLLSTVHKAKGREADRTFLLLPETLGFGPAAPDTSAAAGHARGSSDRLGPAGTVDGEDQPRGTESAEANVLFVALTRAKRDLVLVEAEPGAIARRLELTHDAEPDSLTCRWNDVLRLALVMSGLRGPPGISSPHVKARRVQDRRWQAGRGRRGAIE